jgi:hypothetical protein
LLGYCGGGCEVGDVGVLGGHGWFFWLSLWRVVGLVEVRGERWWCPCSSFLWVEACEVGD